MISKSVMPLDFWRWLEDYKFRHPNIRFSMEDAMDAYNERFFCTCRSCEYRKSFGMWPIPGISPDCKLPRDACAVELHPTHVMFMP